MNCAALRSRVSAFIDRDLAAAETRAFTAHLRECAACARELRQT